MLKIGTKIKVVADRKSLPLRARMFTEQVGVIIDITQVACSDYYRVYFADAVTPYDNGIAAYLENEIEVVK